MIDVFDARQHLRIDGDQDDSEIELKLAEAIALVYGYIGQPADSAPADMFDINLYPTPEGMTEEQLAAIHNADRSNWQARALDAAILLVLGELWRNRESGTADPLSPSVKRILDLFKKPQYA